MHRREVKFKAIQRRPRRIDTKQPFVDPAIEVQTDRLHIANVLRGRLFELKTDCALAATAGGLEEIRGDRRFRRAGAAGEQHAAPSEISLATEHVIEPVE